MKLLKRIKKIASQQKMSYSNNGRRQTLATNNLSPISFHSVHGENIRLSSNGTVAERISSYCKGICFTNRPIRLNEPVTIRMVDISQFWSGVLRFGFTTKDPSTLRNSLPKYACPNLTNCGHTYAKALPERYAHKDCLLSFYLTANGNVHFSINNTEKGVILSNIKINGPFWAVIDLYGNTNKIELVDSRHNLNNNNNRSSFYESERLYSSVSMMDLPNELSHEPSPQIYSGKYLDSLQFHRTRGCNVRLSSNKCVAERNNNYYSNGYVFTQRPLVIGEKIILQILRTDEMFTGSLAFGLTSCNPNNLNVTDLPEDSHHFLDRPEYWTVIKDVANSPMAGDEIAFSIAKSGEVIMIKNRQRPITLMHVDTSQNLWAFFDLYGSTLKVRMLGSQPINRPYHQHPRHHKSMTPAISMHNLMYKSSMDLTQNSSYSTQKASNHQQQMQNNWQFLYKTINNENKVNATKNHQHFNNAIYQVVEQKLYNSNSIHSGMSTSSSGGSSKFGNECVVCYEEPVNSVFYTCGHVCMCYKCSIKQWQTNGHCPICRARIVDVIKTYWS